MLNPSHLLEKRLIIEVAGECLLLFLRKSINEFFDLHKIEIKLNSHVSALPPIHYIKTNAIDILYLSSTDFRLTKASVAEQPVALEMLDEFEERAPLVAERAKHLSADKGYDDGKNIVTAHIISPTKVSPTHQAGVNRAYGDL